MSQELAQGSGPQSRDRRPQERAVVTRNKLVQSAAREFAERGYDAVTLRDIEAGAGVQRNLINYHFGTKEEVWKASARYLISKMEDVAGAGIATAQGLPIRERLVRVIQNYVHFSSEYPDFNRLMKQETKRDSWRLHWLLDQHVRTGVSFMWEVIGIDQVMSREDFVHWYYILIDGGAQVFSLAPEVKHLFDVDVIGNEAFAARHTEMMVDLLLSQIPEEGDAAAH